MTPEEFGTLFSSFRRTAFRLETLAHYSIPEEAESLRLWHAGQPPPPWQTDREWLKLVRAAAAAGKSIQRVRIVRRPLSDYIRLEFDWGYPDNERAGEAIHILELGPGDELPGLPEPDSGRGMHDFWLFDDVTVVRMEYDHRGRFLRPVAASEHATAYCRCRDLVLARAVPFSTYQVQAS